MLEERRKGREAQWVGRRVEGREGMAADGRCSKRVLVASIVESSRRLTIQVRLHSLLLLAPDDGRAPKKVKLFANRESLDFDGAEDANADHELTFEDMSSMGKRIEVKLH